MINRIYSCDDFKAGDLLDYSSFRFNTGSSRLIRIEKSEMIVTMMLKMMQTGTIACQKESSS